MSLPTPIGPFVCQLHQDEEIPISINPGWDSWVISELWFGHMREAPAILNASPLAGCFPALALVAQEALPALFAGSATISIQRVDWISELRKLADALTRWPLASHRYFFAPVLPAGSPQPVYSHCTLRTGKMIAGYDLCQINRNWDGIDRVEDLTPRDVFTDASGDIAIVRRTLAEHLNADLRGWADILERQSSESVFLTLSRSDVDADALAWEVLQRAERWRQRNHIPDYQPSRIAEVNRQWPGLVERRQGGGQQALDLGAYLSEMMRGMWGGQYCKELPAPLPAPAVRGKKAPPAQRAPVMVLRLPFDCQVSLLDKAARAWQQKRKVDWGLQFEVLRAQRRQRSLLMHLGQQLFHPSQERRHAALRLLADVQDARVDRLLIEALGLASLHPDDIMHMLERLRQSRMPVPTEPLVALAQSEHPGVAARALWLLGRQGWAQLPDLLVQRLSGRGMLPLRPLARQLLTNFGEDTRFPKERKEKAHAQKVLRSLGPIPPATTPEQLLPMPPAPLIPLPMLSELLEDSSNPTNHETALRLLIMFPNREESETLGTALADPDPEVRRATIGLLARCDRPLARQLLQTRVMFEQDPLCRTFLQIALGTTS